MFEKDILLFEKMNEIYDNKINFMIESLDTQLKINMLEAQCKIITENGTKEDFEYLYMEAKKDIKLKTTGIITGIINHVKDMTTSVVNFFGEKKIDSMLSKLGDVLFVSPFLKKEFEKFNFVDKTMPKLVNIIKIENPETRVNEMNKIQTIIDNEGLTIEEEIKREKGNRSTIKMNKKELKKSINWMYKTFKTNCENLIKTLNQLLKKAEHVEDTKLINNCVRFLRDGINKGMKWCSNIVNDGLKNKKNTGDK